MRFLCGALILTMSGFASDIKPEQYLAHIKYLASPELKGRRTGTPELEKAAAYIAKQFKDAHLKPVQGSYLQEFDVTARTELGMGDQLAILEGEKVTELKEGREFVPLNLSSNGEVIGPVVFAGYGITAPEYHYDDYAGLDARGKIILLLRHEPQEMDEKSAFDGKNLTIHSELQSKVTNAKLHGAAAVLLVNDAANHPGDEDKLIPFTPLMATEDYGILVEQLSTQYADELLSHKKQNTAELIKQIDSDLKPRSFEFSSSISAKLVVRFAEEKRHVHNVIGYLPGRTREYVILGAHYDHLGLGEQNSLSPSQMGTVHPGADDNASGTAGVIELARSLASSGKHQRGFLFLCFAGEEEGLLGSSYFVNHPEEPLNEAVAMINMDMIGRLRDKKVYVGGVGTGTTFRPIVEKAARDAGVSDDTAGSGGYGGSDHMSFTAKRIPTLFFFSGLHSDYHKPSDTWDKINAPDAVKVLDEVMEVAKSLADAPDRPAFVREQPSPHAAGTAGGGSGYGPYFGSIPDFGEGVKGVKFSDVRDGSPAAKAGFKAGDVMVEFDGKVIGNLYDFTYALRAHKPGDTVNVKVLRNNQPFEAQVILTKRP